jgi:putative transposase
VVSRRQSGSANREKAIRQLAKAYLRVANVRKNALHQVTSLLATLAPAASAGETKSAVVLENLNVSGMVKNHHLAQAILDVGFSEFRRQMTYKGQWYGCQVILADKYFPSSKRCSQCGHIQATLDLGTRVYICEQCGMKIDRDLNAAINLEQWTTGSSLERYACGEIASPGYQAVLVEAGTEQQYTFV